MNAHQCKEFTTQRVVATTERTDGGAIYIFIGIRLVYILLTSQCIYADMSGTLSRCQFLSLTLNIDASLSFKDVFQAASSSLIYTLCISSCQFIMSNSLIHSWDELLKPSWDHTLCNSLFLNKRWLVALYLILEKLIWTFCCFRLQIQWPCLPAMLTWASLPRTSSTKAMVMFLSVLPSGPDVKMYRHR